VDIFHVGVSFVFSAKHNLFLAERALRLVFDMFLEFTFGVKSTFTAFGIVTKVIVQKIKVFFRLGFGQKYQLTPTAYVI
jgi:hypothetical protein